MTWYPHITVAAVIEQRGRFLMIKEQAREGVVLNQPAGHLEDRETPVEAVVRETYEETGHRFQPEYLIGLFQWRVPATEHTYFRLCFAGKSLSVDEHAQLDDGIIEALWLDYASIQQGGIALRSPMVCASIDAYLAGNRIDLDSLKQLT